MVPISDDDDLLILSDDESDNGEVLVIDENSVGSENNTIINNDITSVEDELITFDDTQDSSFKNQVDNNTQELASDDSETSALSFDNDMSNESIDLNGNTPDIENIQVEPIEIKKEEDFSFGVSSSSHIGTMEEILTKTMDELSIRADSIEDEIDVEKNKIDDLNQQIKILEANVQEGNDKVLKLTSEKTSIIKNLKSIERMKNSTQIDEVQTKSKGK